MDFRGYIYSPPSRIFSQLLLPLAQVKKLFLKIYHFLLKSVWSELISGEQIESEVMNLFIFLIFCLFSWLFFRFNSYREIIIATFFILWLIDKQVSELDYKKAKNWLPIAVNLEKSKLSVKKILPQSEVIYLEYSQSDIISSAIAPRLISSHSFQTNIAITWQTILYLNNRTEILINEANSPAIALAKLKPLALQLEIPIQYLNSEGNHPYAMSDLDWDRETQVSSIQVEKKNNQTWHIYSKWRLQDSWQLLKQIFLHSGFFIFVIIMSRLMIKFGGFLNALITSWLGNQGVFLNFSYFWQGLTSNFGMTIYFELLLSIGLIIVEGIIISQTKHIYLDQSLIKFVISNKKEAQLARDEIEAVLFIRHPNPVVLILGKNKAITIKNLQNQDAYRYFVEAIEKANH